MTDGKITLKELRDVKRALREHVRGRTMECGCWLMPIDHGKWAGESVLVLCAEHEKPRDGKL